MRLNNFNKRQIKRKINWKNKILNLNLKRNLRCTLQNKYLLFGEIPFMTEKGTFIINGNTRIIGVI